MYLIDYEQNYVSLNSTKHHARTRAERDWFNEHGRIVNLPDCKISGDYICLMEYVGGTRKKKNATIDCLHLLTVYLRIQLVMQPNASSSRKNAWTILEWSPGFRWKVNRSFLTAMNSLINHLKKNKLVKCSFSSTIDRSNRQIYQKYPRLKWLEF